ncbi:dihydrofolate reductase [Diplogelasinospora grovesii]|uniref:Dihydrofolate reductase n=1 Tax=Diplogelasinospora grovesii TaxID=303347 RepID=A0AAN6N5T7_9PEZI|nr:dihydrofolate reductase [Diplogelasinospora grovesii]
MLRALSPPSGCLSRTTVRPTLLCRRFCTTMGDSSAQHSSSESASERKKVKAGNNGKKEVRILMLHGYTQSGALFRAKTRALEKLLAKALAPVNMVPALVYPTGPSRLSPRDIPGYEPPEDVSVDDVDEKTDSWAWFRKDEASNTYRLLDQGMNRLAEVMAECNTASATAAADDGGSKKGVIDGVIGFSQGGSMAAMLASAMEETRSAPESEQGWVTAVRKANGDVPLKFAVIYSGFYAVPDNLAWLYEPKIRTPTLHFIGSLDTVVDEARSQGLVDRCQDPVVIVHPGGHYVPVSKEWAMPLAGFIRKCVEGHS